MSQLQIFLLTFLCYACMVDSFGSNCGNGLTRYYLKHTDDLYIKPDDSFTPKNVKIALFGDQGHSWASRKVLKMIRDWEADFIIHLGDFDYDNDPHTFNHQINKILGKDFPYFGMVGNHDLKEWKEYQKKLIRRLQRGGNEKYCRGEYGVNMVCNFKGIVFVLSGVGTLGNNHAEFIDKAFKENPGAWKICTWHKNQHDYQLGSKPDETGYGVYEVCRKYGAIIATGHEHSFARTHIMSNFEQKEIFVSEKPLRLEPGKSFMFVAGTGGRNLRPMRKNGNSSAWWAATAAEDTGLNYGAMLCTFYYKGNENKARCKFQDIDGKIWDDFIASREDLPMGNWNTKECSYPIFETQVNSPGQIQGHVNHGILSLTPSLPQFVVQISESHDLPSCKTTMITFSVTFNLQGIKIAQIQLYGAKSEGKAHFIIRGVDNKTGKYSKSYVKWDSIDDNEDFEVDSVWVSPNVAEIIDEISEFSSEDETITFAIEGHGDAREVYAGDNPCLAPALFIQYFKKC